MPRFNVFLTNLLNRSYTAADTRRHCDRKVLKVYYSRELPHFTQSFRNKYYSVKHFLKHFPVEAETVHPKWKLTHLK